MFTIPVVGGNDGFVVGMVVMVGMIVWLWFVVGGVVGRR